MESLFKLQLDTRNIIERGRVNFKKSSKDRLTYGYIETRLESLEEQWKKFSDTHRTIIEKAIGEEMKGSYFKSDMYETTEELYIIYKSELKDCKSKLVAKDSREQSSSYNGRTINVKLPKINIPTFSGHYAEWTSFRDLFMSLVHNDNSIDEVQKLHYLKGSLSGEAEQLLRQIPITAANYQVCWDQLEHRYNNKRHLSNCILNRLLNQRRVGSESAATLKNLLDTTTDCMSALGNLGINVTTWDIIVIHIVSSKLDQETRKQWELKVASDSSTELPTLHQFKEFIESRFRALEFIEPVHRTGQTSGAYSGHKVMFATKTDRGSVLNCEYCQEEHKLCFCKGFIKLNTGQRRQFVSQNRICFNCLGGNHLVGRCKNSTSCRVCKKRHHTLLHVDDTESTFQTDLEDKQDTSTEDLKASEESGPLVSCLSTKKIAHQGQVLLATALVKARTAVHDFQIVRALLDQGSQASFITEAAVQLLRLKKSPVKSVVSSLGNDRTMVASSMVTLELQSLTESNYRMQVKAYVLRNITSYLPDRQFEPIGWSELEHLTLADPHFSTPNKIDILLGADVYSKVLRDGVKKCPTGSFVAQRTSLGWILSGGVFLNETNSSNEISSSTKISVMHAQIDQIDFLKRFWEIEDQLPPAPKILTEEEQRCEHLFASSTARTEDGRYVVRLPFKEPNPNCVGGNNRDIAIRRFNSLEKKFDRDANLKEKYTQVIQEYLLLNHMRRVEKPDHKLKKAVYLPHHAVIREDKSTTKVRVVFDAFCKNGNGVSLNDTLMVGPTLQADLRHIVLRWRTHRIALVADIVKMYRQVRVAEKDVVYQRIVWRNNREEELQDYELTTVTFGTASAPYLAVKTLHQVALDEGAKFPAASERVPISFYMDDLMTGCATVEDGKRLCTEMKELVGKAGFELQKWNSNSKEILKDLECNLEGDRTDKDERKDQTDIFDSTKILGLTWGCGADEFRYSVQLPPKSERVTKRNIISDIARLFDPLGWLAPSIILAKILIQKLWLAGISWDDEVPYNLKQEWETYRCELLQLCKVRVPRWLGTTENVNSIELHGFSDASKLAYAAVVYTRTIDSSGNVRVALLVAKTKVAPIKQVSIPRLELCGAVLLARLLLDVAQAMKIAKDKVRAWTDSTVVLGWLNSHPSRWKTFVGNRVSEILTTLDADQWAHVSSKDNPADCASRGVQPGLLSENTFWYKGPEFLYHDEITYNRPNVEIHLEESIKSHVTVTESELPWNNFSSLWRLVKVIAYCRRLIDWKNRKNRPSYLQRTELEKALKWCIKQYQKREFQEEYSQIKEGHITFKGSKIKSLSPFIDSEDIIRVGGRLDKALLSDQVKHPIIIPHQAHIARLLVADAHDRTLHGGPQLMITYLRSAYWIIGVKSLVKQHVRRCVTCAKQRAVVSTQLMGSLPSARCRPTRPFLHSGLDYAGPVNIRTTKGRGHGSYKGYICVFVCMTTRAVHLEAVSDLSTQGFLAAFRRFVSRRGHCAQIWSDNGTHFIGANRELKELSAAQKSSAEHLESKGTTWHFIPPHAPNFGGLWEAAVKSTKFHLKRVIGDSRLTYEEMSTLLSQIEACLNSRPMTVINGEDLDEPLPLTPGHFLVGEPLVTVPEPNYEGSYVSPLKRWQLLQKMVQDFWRRWSAEYLTNLVHRYKWSFQKPEPQIGDVVLVKEADLPPARWLLGRIVKKHPGSDSVTRVVTLRTKGSLLKRPTSKLCILPVNEN